MKNVFQKEGYKVLTNGRDFFAINEGSDCLGRTTSKSEAIAIVEKALKALTSQEMPDSITTDAGTFYKTHYMGTTMEAAAKATNIRTGQPMGSDAVGVTSYEYWKDGNDAERILAIAPDAYFYA